MISIFDVIKQKSEIFKFYKKASKINYKLKIKENKIFINFIIMPTLVLWISLMTFFFINGEGLSISQILSIFFGGLICSFYIVAILDPIFSFMYKRIAKVKKNKELKNPNCKLRYKGINNINDFIYKFEKSLDKKEEVYYLTENPFLNINQAHSHML